ncbi:MAG: hypothetical protein U0414_39490 [Polyangiaceae bacterium]
MNQTFGAVPPRTMKIGAALGILAIGAAVSFAPACGSEATCVADCKEGQAGNCTAIKGDCTAFCDAAEAIRVDSGCGDEQDAYQACLDQGPVCDQSCQSTEAAYRNCVIPYCIIHGSDKNCQTMANSF